MKHWKSVLAISVLATAQTASAQPQKYYTGDGGKGIRLAVLEPVGKGLSADEQWMPSLVQGSISGDFNKYSGMTIIDRQNLEKIFAEWKEGMSGNYSDADHVKIGNLTNASHILTGSISKTKTTFMLELTVTDVASGERKASYPPKPVSTLALENLSAIKAASADLMRQLGVELTDAAQGELKQTENTARVQAETMLARGIAAQRQGTEVAALSYFFQAAALDTSLIEASSRSSLIAANISSGNIGADIRNDIVWRKNWVARLKETEEIFYKMINAADWPYTLYYSTNIQTTNINYQTETADLKIRVVLGKNLVWFKTMNKTIKAAQAVLDGLNTTNKKKEWGLAGWPKEGVSNANPFTTWKSDIAVVFELVNEKGRVIGGQTIRINPNFVIDGSRNNKFVVEFTGAEGNVNFNGVKADDISDNLTIRVASVNGAPPQRARFAITAMMPVEKLVDTRDGKEYNTVRIGGSVWLGRNLDYQIIYSWCYENNKYNCGKYGRLYDWNTAKTVCPSGWHLPTREEWEDLVTIAGGNEAGKALKSTQGWKERANGTDVFGFSAMPGGIRRTDGYFRGIGNFRHAGDDGYWWTATENGRGDAYGRNMRYNSVSVYEDTNDKEFGFAVRCVRD
jgi:uncharacterized protein (TIGR02145 family)